MVVNETKMIRGLGYCSGRRLIKELQTPVKLLNL